MFRTILTLGAIGLATTGAWATEIGGTVSSKCSVFTANAGVYGNPTADELSTKAADGGIDAKVTRISDMQKVLPPKLAKPPRVGRSPRAEIAQLPDRFETELEFGAGAQTGSCSKSLYRMRRLKSAHDRTFGASLSKIRARGAPSYPLGAERLAG